MAENLERLNSASAAGVFAAPQLEALSYRLTQEFVGCVVTSGNAPLPHVNAAKKPVLLPPAAAGAGT